VALPKHLHSETIPSEEHGEELAELCPRSSSGCMEALGVGMVHRVDMHV